MKKAALVSLASIALALTACGSDAVDVGDAPDDVTPPDLVDPDPAPGCALAGLTQYRIVFDSDGGGLERRIYSMRADGTGLEALTPPGVLAREPSLSPDGEQLAYSTPDGIHVLDLGTQVDELLIPGADQPSWTADGTRIAFRSLGSPGGYASLWARRLSDGVDEGGAYCANCSSPEVTPDGTRLIYAEELFREGIEVNSRIASMGMADYTLRDVVGGAPIEMAHPTISPDGVWMAAAFECQNSSAPSLWVSPLSVTTPACEGRRTTPAGAPSATNPKWGPGTFIAYERAEPPRDIAIIAADSGEECVFTGPGDDRNPSWGPALVGEPQ